MDLTLKETCKNLRKLSNGLRVKKECEAFLRQTEEGYIKNSLMIEKPVLKQIETTIEPIKPNSLKYIITTAIIDIPLSIIMGYAMLGAYFDIIMFSLYLLMILLPIACGAWLYYDKIKGYKEDLQKYKETLEKNLNTDKYNSDEYPELLKKYNEEFLRCKESFAQKCVECREKLDTVEKEIANYDGIISPKFYNNINDIVTIIEDGRADSLKEALNIFVSDSRQKDLVKAQQESNRIAEQQMWDAQRHNREMEQQARRQADAVKQQEEARRRGAPNCWQCKNWPCGGDPAYCGSFVKKQ